MISRAAAGVSRRRVTDSLDVVAVRFEVERLGALVVRDRQAHVIDYRVFLPGSLAARGNSIAERDGRAVANCFKSIEPPLRGNDVLVAYTCRSTIFFLISAIAFAGLRCFGQALAQFMMVWQR